MSKLTEDTILSFYVAPILLSYALKLIITGESNWGPYNVYMEGLQVRLLGIMIFVILGKTIYDILIKIPYEKGGIFLVKLVLKNFVLSLFFLFWLIIFITDLIIIEIVKSKIYLLIIVISEWIICLYFQSKFLQKLKHIILNY